MPNQSFKQLKQTIKKLQPTKNTNQTTKNDQSKQKTTKTTKKRFKLPKLGLKKKEPEQELPTVAKALPKGIKIVDKYSII